MALTLLIVILGFSDFVTATMVTAIHTMAEKALGPIDYLQLSTAQKLREVWAARKTEHLILYADCLDAEAADILCKSAPPIIMLATPPEDVAAYLLNSRGQDACAAVRAASASFATLHDVILQSNNMLTVSVKNGLTTNFVDRVVDFLRLPLDADEIDELLKTAKEDLSQRAADAKHSESGAIDPDFGLLSQTLKPFQTIFKMQPATAFTWPNRLFFGDQPPGSPLLGPVDLTGPARIFLYGPYMHLPPGTWLCTIRFVVFDNNSGNTLLAEWLSGMEVLYAYRLDLPKSGKYAFSVKFSVTEPRSPLQLRLAITEGAIEGEFELINVEVRRSNVPTFEGGQDLGAVNGALARHPRDKGY